MSGFGDATVDIHIDAANAEKELAKFLKQASSAAPEIRITTDTRAVTPEIEKAVKAANTTTTVEADTAGMSRSIDQAIPTSAEVPIEADTAGVEQAIVNSVTGVHPEVDVDTGSITPAIEQSIAGADTSVRVDVESSGLAEAEARLQDLGDSGQSAADRIVDAFRPTPGKIAALLGGTIIAAGVSYNALVQRTSAAFETLLGSAQAATAKVNEVIEFARTSPFPRQVFLEATQMLLAFGVEAERTTEVLAAVQDQVAAVGGDAFLIQEIVNVLAEIKSTGDIGAESLNQLGLRGVNAAKIIGEQMGLTEAQVRQAITENTLSAQQAFDALVTGMAEQNKGAAANLKETWVGAVDSVKAAIRDLGSAIVEPFISKEGGGAAVEFANALADSLRDLEDQVVPLAAALSASLVPALEAIGQDLLPALIDASVALVTPLGILVGLFQALGPVISFIATVLNTIPGPVFTAIGAFLLMQRTIEPIKSIFETLQPIVSSAIDAIGSAAGTVAGTVGSFDSAGRAAGSFRAAMTGIGDAVIGAIGAINPLTAALAVAAVGFSLWSAAQQRQAERAQAIKQSSEDLKTALAEEADVVDGLTRFIGDLVEEETKLRNLTERPVDFGGFEHAGELFQSAGINARDFSAALGEGSEAFQNYIDRVVIANDLNEDAEFALRNLGEVVRGNAHEMTQAGIETGAWTEEQVRAAEAQNTLADGTLNQIGVLDTLESEVEDATEAEKAHQEQLTKEQEALQQLIALYPQVGNELASVTDGTRDAEIGFLGLADQLVRTGASGEQISAVASQLGLDAAEFGRFVEIVGGHMETLRADIDEGLPTIDDVFGVAMDDLSAADWASQVLEELNKANDAIENFAPNVDKLVPWPHLREQAARQGPEVAAKYAELADSGNTALLDATEAGIAEFGLQLFGLQGWIDYHTPGFVSTQNAFGLAGANAFNDGVSGMTVAQGLDNVSHGLRQGSIAAREHASEAGSTTAEGFETGFAPDAQPGMAGAQTQIDQATGLPQAAGAAGAAATGAFAQQFNPDVTAAMQGLQTQLGAWKPAFDMSLAVLGMSAAQSFADWFKPDSAANMRTLLDGILTWQSALNLQMAQMGSSAATWFSDSFKPTGSVGMAEAIVALANYGALLNQTTAILGTQAAQAFMDAFRPDPAAALSAMSIAVSTAMIQLGVMLANGAAGASAGFAGAFRPDPTPALALMLFQMQTAALTARSTMLTMGLLSTLAFVTSFKPDPIPQLNFVLLTMLSYVGPIGTAGFMAGQAYRSKLTSELNAGVGDVASIVRNYASQLAAGLNPILAAIGQPQIALQDGSIVTFAQGGLNFARGGTRERHVAQIAPAGAMRIWAEPETGGEAYIPLARSKRERSRDIASETVHRLGGVAMFQRGGVTGDVEGLDLRFLERLAMWAGALGQTYHVGSGFRTLAEQQVLYARYLAGRGAKAAVPGSSMHNFGLASDGPHWANRGPSRFGLTFRVPGEPWHVEPFEARDWARGLPGEGFFAELPRPPDIERTGAVAETAEKAMQFVYDRAVQWSMTAMSDAIGRNVGTVGGNVGSNVDIGRNMAAARGWVGAMWNALHELWRRESNWNQFADNPTSSAYGIPQALPGSKMATHGGDWRTNPVTQIAWGLDYIAGRYGNPLAALAFHNRHNWYGQGGIALADGGVVMGPRGPRTWDYYRQGAEKWAQIFATGQHIRLPDWVAEDSAYEWLIAQGHLMADLSQAGAQRILQSGTGYLTSLPDWRERLLAAANPTAAAVQPVATTAAADMSTFYLQVVRQYMKRLFAAAFRPKRFDNGGVLDRGWNVVANTTGAPERLVRADQVSTVTFAEGSVQVRIETPMTPGEGRLVGRQIGRGIDDVLAARRVQSDARLAGTG